MNEIHSDNALVNLKTHVAHAFCTGKDRAMLMPNGQSATWTLDCRPLLLRSETLEAITEQFWKILEPAFPYQIGGLETSAINLVAGMLMTGARKHQPIGGFYIRKSRRKDGYQQQIEGSLNTERIVLVDDVLNTGRSVMRQIKVLESVGRKVHAICTIVRYREREFYSALGAQGIKIYSLFTLDDFPAPAGMRSMTEAHADAPPRDPFSVEWKFESPHPSYFHIVPKSAPTIDSERLYFGGDNGTLWALNQVDGSIAWRYQTLFGAGKKRIFSSPLVYKDTVLFGAYDGNFYALDAQTGAKKWVYLEADWIGSSPCVAEDLGIIFVGLEFGLWHKEGGLVAIDIKTAHKRWHQVVPTFVHSSPGYSSRHRVVVCGSSAGTIYAFEAASGKARWTFQSGGAVRAGFAIDDKRGYVCFGSEDRFVYVVDSATGKQIHKVETLEAVYSTPTIWNDHAYVGLLDKRVIKINLATGAVVWARWTHARVFATPVFVDDSLYIGSNDGRLYELDPQTGHERSYFQVTERIVNKIAYNPATQRFFVPTYANEIYCLTRRPDGTR